MMRGRQLSPKKVNSVNDVNKVIQGVGFASPCGWRDVCGSTRAHLEGLVKDEGPR